MERKRNETPGLPRTDLAGSPIARGPSAGLGHLSYVIRVQFPAAGAGFATLITKLGGAEARAEV
jgi:hypothetical protein